MSRRGYSAACVEQGTLDPRLLGSNPAIGEDRIGADQDVGGDDICLALAVVAERDDAGHPSSVGVSPSIVPPEPLRSRRNPVDTIADATSGSRSIGADCRPC